MLSEESVPAAAPADHRAVKSKAYELTTALRVALEHIERDMQTGLPPSLERYRKYLGGTQTQREVAAQLPRDLLDVVTGMSRFLSLISGDQMFRRYGVSGLVDWSILMTLTYEPPGITDRQITRLIGLNHKRARQLLAGLSDAGLIQLVPVEQDSKSMAVELTVAGKARVEEMNATIAPTLMWFSQRNQFRLQAIGSSIGPLTRLSRRTESPKS